MLLAVAGILLVSCLGHPMHEDYLGPLSNQHTGVVSETYVSQRLSYAYIDADADGRFDYFVGLCGSGRDICWLSHTDQTIASFIQGTSGRLHSSERPTGVQTSVVLEHVVEAHRRVPRSDVLPKLYNKTTDQTERWLLALTLGRMANGSEVIAKVSAHLMHGELTSESAFILAAYGEQGLSTLGRVMRDTHDKRAARDAAIYLDNAGASAIVALDTLVASLDKDWKNTRHCILAAILNVAQANREAVLPHMNAIRKFARHRDPDIRRCVERIEYAVK